jgi:alkylation response protein AidB-like acyl-CoA dehydrogenase
MSAGAEKTATIAARVEAFVRDVVAPYEQDPRRDRHDCPTEDLVAELKEKARAAGVLTPHILPDGRHLSQRETAIVLEKTGLSPLGPLACNTAAPDEGNMYLLGKVGSAEIKARFLKPLVDGRARSAFFMTEPAEEGGAGSDPSMMLTTCRLDGNHWVINGRKKFITGAQGAQIGIVMAKSEEGACASNGCRTRSTAPCRAGTPSSPSRICACRPTRCWARPARASATRRSACRRHGSRIACAGWARAAARTRSPPIMPVAARPSARR